MLYQHRSLAYSTGENYPLFFGRSSAALGSWWSREDRSIDSSRIQVAQHQIDDREFFFRLML